MASINYLMENLSEKLFKQNFGDNIEFDDLLISFAEIKHGIELFGQWMENITINGSIVCTTNDDILELIQRHCKPKQLRLFCFHINKSTVGLLAQVLQFVEKLELFYCPTNIGKTGKGFDHLFQNCVHLKELSIIYPNATLESTFLTIKFPNLTKFHLIIGKLSGSHSMATFIKNHPKLERYVYLPQNVSTNDAKRWFNQVKILPKNLEEFGVMMTADDVDHYLKLLSELNGLKRIHIECNNIDKSMDAVFDELAEHRSLNVLSMWKPKLSIKHFNALAKMTYLKTLELRQFSNIYKLNDLINSNLAKQSHLKNLYLDETSFRNATDLTVLLKNLKNLQNLYLCDVKNIFLLRDANENSHINPNFKIIIDDHCIWQLPNGKNNNSSITIVDDKNDNVENGVFIPFKDRMSQKFNVLIET